MKTVYFDKDIPRILATKSAARFRFTQGLLFTGINAVKYKTDIPDPPLPADNWVRVKNIACGVCGTDVSFFKATTGTNSALEPIPSSRKTSLGHENIGVVTEVGSSVTQVQVGDRVGIRAYMAGCDNKDLPRCRNCAAGNYSICENYGAKPRFDLPWTGAGWSDSFIAPQQQLYKILPELTMDQAVMVEPSAVAVHAVLLDPPKVGEKIVVMGCGVIGLSIIQALKVIQPDCEIWAMSRTKDKLDFALRLGADHVLTGDALEAASKACGGSPVYQGMSRKNRFFFGGFDRAYDCINCTFCVPTQHIHLLTIEKHGKAELYPFQEPPIRQLFRVNLHTFNKTADKLLFLRIAELIVQLIKIQKKLIHVVLRNLLLPDIVKPNLHVGNVGLRNHDFIVDGILALLQVLILAVIVWVVKIKTVDLLSKPVLCPRKLTEPLSFQLQLLFQFRGVDSAADFFTNGRFKLRGANQTPYYIGHCVIHNVLAPLLVIVTTFAVDVETVLTGVVEIIPVHTPVFFLLTVHIAIHPAAADRAFQDAGKNMLMFKAVGLFLFHACNQPLLVGKLPVLFGDDGFMCSIIEHILILLYDMVLVMCSGDFFIMAASIG